MYGARFVLMGHSETKMPMISLEDRFCEILSLPFQSQFTKRKRVGIIITLSRNDNKGYKSENVY